MRQEAVFCVLPDRNTDLIFQIFSVTKIKNIKTYPKNAMRKLKQKQATMRILKNRSAIPFYEKSCTFLISYIAVMQVQLAKAKKLCQNRERIVCRLS